MTDPMDGVVPSVHNPEYTLGDFKALMEKDGVPDSAVLLMVIHTLNAHGQKVTRWFSPAGFAIEKDGPWQVRWVESQSANNPDGYVEPDAPEIEDQGY